MPCAHCGHSEASHTRKQHCTRCTCSAYVAIVQIHPVEAQAIELAFMVQDPCGEASVTLCREILRLISNRDDTTVLALLSEVRALQVKYPRVRG